VRRRLPAHVTPRSERKGALQLFAGLSVADGRLYGMCRTRKRFVDNQAFLLEMIIPYGAEYSSSSHSSAFSSPFSTKMPIL
jgi:hypothetical protein